MNISPNKDNETYTLSLESKLLELGTRQGYLFWSKIRILPCPKHFILIFWAILLFLILEKWSEFIHLEWINK